MFKKEIIKSVLLEGSTQVSAVLPKRDVQNSRDLFSFFFPVVLNSAVFLDNKTFDKFQVVLYNQETFAEEFDSKISTSTADFKSFSQTNISDSLTNFQKNVSNNFYFDKNIVTNSYDINFDHDLVERINDQKIYKIAFSNTQSKEMLNGNFKCFRIFCIKNNSIVYDTDIIMFSSVNFLSEVFENRKIYDFSYFVDLFYFKDFEESLSLVFPIRNILDQRVSIQITTSSQVDLNIASGSVNFNLQYVGKNASKVLTTNISLEDLSSRIILDNSDGFFEEMASDYMADRKIFRFNLNCTINFDDQSLNKNYNKTFNFRKNSNFINSCVKSIASSFNQRSFNSLNLTVEQKLLSESANFFLAANSNSFSSNILKNFYISNVFQNDISIIDNLYTDDSLNLNSYISLYRKTLFDIFDIESNSLRLYFRNDQRKIFSTITLEIKSKLSEDFVKLVKSDTSLNRQSISNVYSDINKIVQRNILIDDREPELLNVNDDTVINKYNSMQIINLESLNNVAYNLGYLKSGEILDGEFSNVRGDIKDFLSSSVFKIQVEERIDGINDTEFKFKDYFYGEEILNIQDLDENSNKVFFNNEILNKINFKFSQLIKSLSPNNRTLTTIKSILNQSLEERKNNIVFVKNFIENTNISIVKTIKISIIPIPKLIKQFQGYGIDSNNNIIFGDFTNEDTQKNVNIQFLNMFYDSNSSLNWNTFNRFKSTYFFNSENSGDVNLVIEKSKINNITASFARTFYPLWRYLSSDLYIQKNEIFNSVNVISKNSFVESVPEIENNYDNFSENIKNYHFQDFQEEYFNFSNTSNLISIKDVGLSYAISDFRDNNVNEPQTIKFIKNSSLNNLTFVFDITPLKIRHSISEIEDAEIFMKYAIHPLVIQANDLDFTNTGYYFTSIGDSDICITQNSTYMSRINKKFFKGFNIPLNKSSMQVESQSNKIILKSFVDNENDLINTSTFRDMFDFCTQNDCTTLKDFYVRFSISMKINEDYYCFNLHNIIPRINLQNSEVRINNIRNITI
tara:strand:+ start:7189 stop:10260 length:3072 start_codon:yes stop_codon:yes gene_type:complete